MKENSSAKGIIIGFIAGGAIGGLAALLYAPKSGRELRKDISKKSKELINDGEEYLDSAKTKASEIISDGRKKAEEMIRDARSKASAILLQGRDYVTDEASRIKDAVKAGVDTFNDERKHVKTK
ncbi:MAG: YtxH domain-containing protein [Ignavibacteria bacterium]